MIRRGRWAAFCALGMATAWSCPSLFARPADPAALSWEQAFPVDVAKREVYLDAHFVGLDGTSHRLQVWRRGTAFLHRRTDDKLDLYVQRADDQADYSYRLFDHDRRVMIGVTRNRLYRIGVFSDWFGLAHILDRPKVRFSVRAVQPLPGEQRPGCTWRLLVRESGGVRDETRVCWSVEWGLPLVIRTPGRGHSWVSRFTVDRVDDRAILADDLVLPAKPDGYAFFDAGKEIAPEASD